MYSLFMDIFYKDLLYLSQDFNQVYMYYKIEQVTLYLNILYIRFI
jgi:hypothetical protein